MYFIAESKFREAELKAAQLSENARKALEENRVQERAMARLLRELVSQVEPQYQKYSHTWALSARLSCTAYTISTKQP
jgi:hypothetical protein